MKHSRYKELELNGGQLTPGEMREGWHFCPEWDGMLTNLSDKEGEVCHCKPWTEDEIRDAAKEREDG